MTQSYPYLCYQLHLGILHLPLQGVDLVSLCHDLNDEFILKEERYLLPYSRNALLSEMRFKSVYLNGGPAALPLLPSVVSSLQLLQEFVVEHLQLLLKAPQLLLQRNALFLCLKVFLLPAVTCCGNIFGIVC